MTLHDNGSNLKRPPRGVMYQIDEISKTATLIEDVRDNAAPNLTSPCCGSAAKLPSGNWVMSWGGTTSVTELTPAGNRVEALTLGVFSYRSGSGPPGHSHACTATGGDGCSVSSADCDTGAESDGEPSAGGNSDTNRGANDNTDTHTGSNANSGTGSNLRSNDLLLGLRYFVGAKRKVPT